MATCRTQESKKKARRFISCTRVNICGPHVCRHCCPQMLPRVYAIGTHVDTLSTCCQMLPTCSRRMDMFILGDNVVNVERNQANQLQLCRSCDLSNFNHSFIPRTCKLWNVLPSSCFPESYNLPSFKSKINPVCFIIKAFRCRTVVMLSAMLETRYALVPLMTIVSESGPTAERMSPF